MRKNDKEAFDQLTQTEIYNYRYNTDFSSAFLVTKVPPVVLNRDGSLRRAAFSNNFDSLRDMPAEKQKKFIRALNLFLAMLEEPEYKLKFKLDEGDIAVFDNTRVTHGREAFDPSEPRHLEGCYMDWDEIDSRTRVIKADLFREKLAQRYLVK